MAVAPCWHRSHVLTITTAGAGTCPQHECTGLGLGNFRLVVLVAMFHLGRHLLVHEDLDGEGLHHVRLELGVQVRVPDALVQQLPHLHTTRFYTLSHLC